MAGEQGVATRVCTRTLAAVRKRGWGEKQKKDIREVKSTTWGLNANTGKTGMHPR